MAVDLNLREQLEAASRRVEELERECRRLRRLAEECDRERDRKTAYVQTHTEDGALNLVITCPRPEDETVAAEFIANTVAVMVGCGKAVEKTQKRRKKRMVVSHAGVLPPEGSAAGEPS